MQISLSDSQSLVSQIQIVESLYLVICRVLGLIAFVLFHSLKQRLCFVKKNFINYKSTFTDNGGFFLESIVASSGTFSVKLPKHYFGLGITFTGKNGSMSEYQLLSVYLVYEGQRLGVMCRLSFRLVILPKCLVISDAHRFICLNGAHLKVRFISILLGLYQ